MVVWTCKKFKNSKKSKMSKRSKKSKSKAEGHRRCYDVPGPLSTRCVCGGVLVDSPACQALVLPSVVLPRCCVEPVPCHVYNRDNPVLLVVSWVCITAWLVIQQ